MAITRKVDTAGHPIMTELAGHGLLSMRERKDAQLERKSSVKSAG